MHQPAVFGYFFVRYRLAVGVKNFEFPDLRGKVLELVAAGAPGRQLQVQQGLVQGRNAHFYLQEKRKRIVIGNVIMDHGLYFFGGFATVYWNLERWRIFRAYANRKPAN